MGRTGVHYSTRRGKRVRVILKDRTQFIDVFLKSEGAYVWLKEHGQIRKKHITSMADYKPLPHEMENSSA